MDSFITARWVLPVSSPPIEDGALLVRGGRVARCGPRESLEKDAGGCRRLVFADAALLPGLVNVHAHLELTALRGSVEERDFFRWIRRLTRTKLEVLRPEDLLASSYWGALEATRAGVTTVGEVADLGVSREALAASGLRGVLYQEVFGPQPEAAEESFAGLVEKLDAHQEAAGDRLRVGVSPHAVYTVSAELFERVTRLALERSLPVSIHAAESRAEAAFLERGEGPFAEFLEGRGIRWVPPGCSAIEYLERLGVLEARPLLAHCVHCSRRDAEIIARSGSAVAHCPKSNGKFGHGVAPVAVLEELGVRVGLGSDSVASNNACDLFEEARFGSLLQRLNPQDGRPAGEDAPAAWLRRLTLGGAEALGLGGLTGSLEEGKCADVIAVDLSSPHLQPLGDVEAALIFSARASDVVFTMVEGEVLFEGGRCLRLDEAALRQEVAAVAKKLVRRQF